MSGANRSGDDVREVVISGIVPEAVGVVSLLLSPVGDEKLPSWEPGAHIDLFLGPDLERQYSLCGNLSDPSRWQVSVLREPESRGGSAWVHEKLQVGDVLRCRGPRNNFSLQAVDEYLFIAGGIGITPILPMIARCIADNLNWRLVYGGRSKASMAFTDLLAEHGERVKFWPQDTHGLIDLDTLLAEPRSGVAIYSCGPEPLLAAVEDRCRAWPAGTLHLERFRPRQGALDGPSTAFEVELDESGMVLEIPAEASILDTLEAAGVYVPNACREGTCGTCETVVLEGEPDHRDSFLTEEERASGEVMMVCCSRALSKRLVLDL
ncbi:oxidoreductase [Rhodococcus sp. WS3]|uniref:PDR/VanB family oxidoreductase n=1 Tax=Rhodococcus sp. WS3 TaxID=2486271 RepID=UPI001142306F|nr:PDR/VanB family oxidoreductase [Rhodococcus sp. WS3]ROZ49033.1 oxidoreductase [Rhodococcus sp. WS3]